MQAQMAQMATMMVAAKSRAACPWAPHGNAGDGNSSQSQSEEPEQGGGIWSDRPQREQEGGPDRSGGRFPDSVTSLQLRRHLQHPRQHHGAGPDVQVEAFATYAEDETGSGGRQVNQEEMEEEPEMDHAHERQIPGGTMGPSGQRPSVVLQPEGLPPSALSLAGPTSGTVLGSQR